MSALPASGKCGVPGDADCHLRKLAVPAAISNPANPANPAESRLTSMNRLAGFAGFSRNGHIGNPANPADLRTCGVRNPANAGFGNDLRCRVSARQSTCCGLCGLCGVCFSPTHKEECL